MQLERTQQRFGPYWGVDSPCRSGCLGVWFECLYAGSCSSDDDPADHDRPDN